MEESNICASWTPDTLQDKKIVVVIRSLCSDTTLAAEASPDLSAASARLIRRYLSRRLMSTQTSMITFIADIRSAAHAVSQPATPINSRQVLLQWGHGHGSLKQDVHWGLRHQHNFRG